MQELERKIALQFPEEDIVCFSLLRSVIRTETGLDRMSWTKFEECFVVGCIFCFSVEGGVVGVLLRCFAASRHSQNYERISQTLSELNLVVVFLHVAFPR